MTKILANKADALRHIEQLYPIGSSDKWDKIWLQEIEDLGIENLPEILLKRMAANMLASEGEEVIIPEGNGLMDGVTRD